jgi:uncharacterized protein YxjI
MLNFNQFFIKEHVGLFKLSNAYDIIDPQNGQKIGLAQEKIGKFFLALRFLISKQTLPTRVDIIENPNDKGEGRVVVSIVRGWSLLRAKVRVLVDGDKEVGYFKSKLFSLGGGFFIYDTKDIKVAEIKGDWKGWNFKLLDTTGKELGTISKKWAGLGKEMFTSADNYMISLSGIGNDNLGTKALMLAAGIAIDTVYKEK